MVSKFADYRDIERKKKQTADLRKMIDAAMPGKVNSGPHYAELIDPVACK